MRRSLALPLDRKNDFISQRRPAWGRLWTGRHDPLSRPPVAAPVRRAHVPATASDRPEPRHGLVSISGRVADGHGGEDEALTAEEFLAKDQREFGDAWRYELVDGRILAHAAPTPTHGAIVAGLSAALGSRLRGHAEGCRPEAGSGAAPVSRQRGAARIPDAMVRCDELPRIVFEVVSASELKAWRERDRKRVDLQEAEGVREIVEVHQDEMAGGQGVVNRPACPAWLPAEAARTIAGEATDC